MSQSGDLAQKFEQANAAVIASIEACGHAEWQATTSEEGWTAAALAHHIADDHALISGLVTSVGAGGCFEDWLTNEDESLTHCYGFLRILPYRFSPPPHTR